MKSVIVLLLVCVCAAAILGGCHGVADSREERALRYDQITHDQWRQAVDDWDYLWLYDRNSRLTMYPDRIGQ